MIRLSFVIGLTCFLAWPSSAYAEDFWRVTSAQARCILENVELYTGANDRVLMIVAAGCPEPDPAAALAAITKNSTVPSLKIAGDEGEVDGVLVYKASELTCLAQLQIDLSSEIVRLPKEPKC